MNKDLIDSTKKLLYEQHGEAGRSYSLQQDSLDKAFTTILLAEIAFYIAKIVPNEHHVVLDIISVAYISLALFIVFLSYIRSKTTLTILRELIEKEIYVLDDPENGDKLLKSIEHDQVLFNKSMRILSHLNRHIPIMIFISTCICLTKAITTNYEAQLIIYICLLLLYILISLVVFIYSVFKR